MSYMNKEITLVKEFARKTVHLVSASMVLFYYAFGKNNTIILLTLILLCFLVVEYFRVEKKIRIPIVWKLYRPKEENALSGSVNFLIGGIIVISVFSQEVASAAILMTTFGDTAAALVGTVYGKTWIKGLPGRAWEGVAAEFLVDLVIGYLILLNWSVAIIMALVATVVETFIYKLDDNLIIPLFSGAFGQLFLRLLFIYRS